MSAPEPGDEDYRASAEVVEHGDGPEDWEVRPPTVTVRDGVPAEVEQAVRTAVEQEPNKTKEPTLFVPDDAHDRVLARLTASYTETPPPTGDPSDPWLPPYRAREDFDAVLTNVLPDNVRIEHKNNHTTTFYRA